VQQLTTTTTDTQSVCDSYISCYYIIISQQFTAKYETNSEMEKNLLAKPKTFRRVSNVNRTGHMEKNRNELNRTRSTERPVASSLMNTVTDEL